MTKPIAAATLLAVVLCVPVGAQSSDSTAVRKNLAARTYFTDVVLLNQDGKEMRFFTDVIEGKTVIVITFFTTCTSICPPLNRNMQLIQDWLGDRMGREVHLVGISVDPAHDTPPRLKAFAERYRARPGWYFLTGKKENVDLALRKLGQSVETKEDHTSVMIIGNQRTGLWKKARALSKFEELLPVVESVLNDKGEVSTNGK